MALVAVSYKIAPNSRSCEVHMASPFLNQVRQTIRLKQMSFSTEDSYLFYVKQFILFHNKRHPLEMGLPEIEAFLTHLAVKENVAASTQNQSLSALLFLYRDVLQRPGRFHWLHPRSKTHTLTKHPAQGRRALRHMTFGQSRNSSVTRT